MQIYFIRIIIYRNIVMLQNHYHNINVEVKT